MLVLGIESSCDDTAAAIVRDGTEILSSVISSQIAIHKKWGGVVPNLASREHLAKIDIVVKEAFEQANRKFDEIDAIAVTQGPGLVGSLLVGVVFAKTLAMVLKKPFVGVNHIEGHVFSVNFDNPTVKYPAFALIVSGGHTNLFYVPEAGKYKILARTRDDAAGEAFDKVSKMLGLGYPGGPIVEQIALEGDATKVKFSMPKISDGRPDYSFSGMKTAVSRFVRENEISPLQEGEAPTQIIKDLCASFQYSAVKHLIGAIEKLAGEYQPQTLIVAGGVACNNALREAATITAQKLGIPAYFPSKHLSTDNAAMIAAAGEFHLNNGVRADYSMTADTKMRLQNLENEDDALRKAKVRYKL